MSSIWGIESEQAPRQRETSRKQTLDRTCDLKLLKITIVLLKDQA